MKMQIGRIVILVKDYEEAYRFYNEALGCTKLFDTTTDDGQRFLHIGFSEGDSIGIWFLKAGGKEVSRVGNQTAGPLMVIYTDQLEEVYIRLKQKNVSIKSEPVITPEYKFLHFLDLYGNEIVLVELKK